jgi:hypothetical protein
VVDFEDLTRAPGPDPARDYLYLADTGDNDLSRAEIVVLRIEEPAVDLAMDDVLLDGIASDELILEYDDGASHDAEALVIEPDTGDLYLITKRNPDDPDTLVFRATAVAAAPSGRHVLHRADAPVAALDGRVVTATLSPDATLLLIGIKDQPFRLWPRDGSIAQTLAGAPCSAPTGEGQIESAAFALDGAGYYMVPEGEAPPIYLTRFDWPRP